MAFLLVFPFVAFCNARKCKTVNGIKGACNLSLQQFSLAGTHNSAAGAKGLVYYWSNTAASSMMYRNQGLNITQQLEHGIRYFDFDVRLIDGLGNDGWWRNGLALVHGKGYSGLYFLDAMKEIGNFMKTKKDALVVVRMKDYFGDAGEIGAKLGQDLSNADILGITSKIGQRNPTLSDSFKYGKRLFLYAHEDIVDAKLGYIKGKRLFLYAHEDIVDAIRTRAIVQLHVRKLEQIESYGKGLNQCSREWNLRGITEDLRLKQLPLQIDWYNTFPEGSDPTCSNTVDEIQKINDRVLIDAGRPVNLVLVDDYAGDGKVLKELTNVVKLMNEDNVKFFSGQGNDLLSEHQAKKVRKILSDMSDYIKNSIKAALMDAIGTKSDF